MDVRGPIVYDLEFLNDNNETVRIYRGLEHPPAIPRIGERVVIAERYEAYDVRLVMHTFHEGDDERLTCSIAVYCSRTSG